MQSQFITALIFQLGSQLPSLVLYMAGIALSLYSRPKNPGKFLLTTISFLIFLLITLANSMLSVWIITQHAEGGFSNAQLSFGYQALGTVTELFRITAWIILFVAIFNHKYNSTEASPNQLNQ